MKEIGLYLVDILRIIWSRRKLFVLIWGGITVISVVLILLLPSEYTARSTILPPTESSSQAALSQVSGLLGISTPSQSVGPDLYPVIAGSNTVLGEVLDSEYADSTFYKYFLKGQPPTALNRTTSINYLRSTVHVVKDRITGAVSMSYTSDDSLFAAALLNSVLSHMEEYFRFKVNTSVRNQRDMIALRLSQISDSLKIVEDKYISFKEQNRQVTSPALAMDDARYQRRLRILNEAFVDLSKQYELIKIDEVGATPVLNVLDYASVPLIESFPPSRSLLAVLMCGFGFVLSVMWVRYDSSIRYGVKWLWVAVINPEDGENEQDQNDEEETKRE